MPTPDVLVLRDPRESSKKCSLTPLRGLDGIQFVEYRADRSLNAAGRILLHPEGAELGQEDAARGILLVDSSWRRLPKLLQVVEGEVVRRRLPPLTTAYPRRSRLFADPDQGLASVEALYAALAILGRPRADLLAGYYWAEEFLSANPNLAR